MRSLAGNPAFPRTLWAIGLPAALLYLILDIQSPIWLNFLLKPVPVLCLAIWTGLTERDSYGRRITAGLLMAMAGDIALVWPGERAFLAGLGFNLLAHLCYNAAFLSTTTALKLLRALPFVLWIGMIYAVLFPSLGGMRIPVALYSVAISTMMWRAAARLVDGRSSRSSQWLGVFGAVGFAICDSLIALNRFHSPIPGVTFPIMASYWLGQLGLARSARRSA